jgi:hypothetical protein
MSGELKSKLEVTIKDFFFIIDQLKLAASILFRPKKTLYNLLQEKKVSLLKATTFLLINILLVYSFKKLLRFEVNKFSLAEVAPILGNISLLSIRFILGIFIFVMIIRILYRPRLRKGSISRLFIIVCYASAIFFPFLVVKTFVSGWFGNIFLNIAYSVFSKSKIEFGVGETIRLILGISLIVFFVIWWLWLIYYGLKLSYPENKTAGLKSLVLLSFCLFFLIQSLSVTILSIKYYRPLFLSLKIIMYDLDKVLTQKPPNYLKAALLCNQIAEAKPGLPPYYVYAAKIRAVTYKLATPNLFDVDNKILKIALGNIEKGNYLEAQNMLTNYLKRLQANKQDVKRPFYNQLLKTIEEADKILSSPDFVDRSRGEELRLFLPFLPAPFILLP